MMTTVIPEDTQKGVEWRHFRLVSDNPDAFFDPEPFRLGNCYCDTECQTGCQVACEGGSCETECKTDCQVACEDGSCQTTCECRVECD